MGYFSYEYLGYSEPAVRCEVEDAEKFKDVDVMLFDKVIAFDHVKQKLILIVNMPLSDVEVGYNKAVVELKQMAGIADGAIVGSAIIKILEKYGTEAPKYVGEYVKEMKNAIR